MKWQLWSFLVFLSLSIPGLGQDIPPPPPPPAPDPARDSMLFVSVHPDLRQWLEGCRSDSCEQFRLQQLLHDRLTDQGVILQDSVHLGYVVEKNGRLGWVELLADRSEGQGDRVRAIFESLRGELRWCCVRARRRPVRLYRELWVGPG